MRLTIVLSIIVLIFYTNLYSKAGFLIPLYSCPSDENGKIWGKIYKAGPKVNIIIIWGIICPENDYRKILKKFHKVGIKNVAYISTNNSSKSFDIIKKEIKKYAKFPIDGFFFDEVSNSKKSYIYNNKIIQFAKKHSGNIIIVNSPFSDLDFLKMIKANIVIIFENFCNEINTFDLKMYKKIKNPELAIILHHCFKKEIFNVLKKVKDFNINWIYITDKNYDKLPTYFDVLTNILK